MATFAWIVFGLFCAVGLLFIAVLLAEAKAENRAKRLSEAAQKMEPRK